MNVTNEDLFELILLVRRETAAREVYRAKKTATHPATDAEKVLLDIGLNIRDLVEKVKK